VTPERRRGICNWIIAVAIVHFVVFVGTILAFGGDAITGRVEDGQYFLGNHGQYVEVPRGTWLASAIVGRTLLYGTFPLGVLAALAKPRRESRTPPRIWWKRD
jgi:hypothetical protein